MGKANNSECAYSLQVKHIIYPNMSKWQLHFHRMFWEGIMGISPTRRKNSNNCKISHFPVSKQGVKVQFSLDMLGKELCQNVPQKPYKFFQQYGNSKYNPFSISIKAYYLNNFSLIPFIIKNGYYVNRVSSA